MPVDNPASSATLATIGVGETALVVALGGSGTAQRRLAEMGVRPGVPVTVLGRTPGGGRILGIGTSRLAVDTSTARAVTVGARV